MGELHESGKTIMHLKTSRGPEEPKDELLEGVRQMAAGDYEVFGEIGRGHDSTVVYLARDIQAFKLIALKLSPSLIDPDEYVLDVINELDSTVPSIDNPCHKCGSSLQKWGRFCPKCGVDLYNTDEQKWTAEELRDAVQEFATDRFEILGEMITQGGGRIYFARDIPSGRVEALRLQKKSGDEFSLGFTGILKPVVASVVGTDRPSIGMTGPYPTINRSPVEPPKLARTVPRDPLRTPIRPAPPPARPKRRPPVDQDPWAPLRNFIQHPVVLTVLLACLVLVLLILLAMVT